MLAPLGQPPAAAQGHTMHTGDLGEDRPGLSCSPPWWECCRIREDHAPTCDMEQEGRCNLKHLVYEESILSPGSKTHPSLDY